MKTYIFIIIALLFTLFPGKSQDVIHFNNGRTSKVKIIHVKNDTIFYINNNGYSKRVKATKIKNIRVIFFKDRQKSYSLKKDILAVGKMDRKEIFIKGKKDDTIKQKNNVFVWALKKNAKPLGLGMDLAIQDKNQGLAGLSIDYYLNRNINIGLGYGYFYGRPKFYANAKIVFNEIRSDWCPILNLLASQLTIDPKLKSELNIDKYVIDRFYDKVKLLIPSVGVEYREKSGFIFDLKLGASLIENHSKVYFNALTMSFRVAIHI